MKLRDAVSLSTLNLCKNPVRTALTILGLGVGVGAILTVLTLGDAGQAQVETEIARLGVDKVWISSEDTTFRPLQPADSAVVSAVTGSDACAGAYTLGSVSLDEKTILAQIKGYDEGAVSVHDLAVEEGRLFTQKEWTGGNPVAVVDLSMSNILGGEVVGKRISVGNRKVRVIGVVSDLGTQVLTAGEGGVLLPLRTFMDTYAQNGVDELTVSIPKGMRAEAVGEAAVSALSDLGGTYRAMSLQTEIDAARSVIRIFVMVLTCVAVVCMLVGGIGVMNILLVSVRERHREIGLMKAVGGTSSQVGLLFLLEAASYALLGGLLGLVLGIAMIRLFGAWIGLNAMLEARSAIPALIGAALLGIGFGVVPALRAAAMVPVNALKQE